MSSIYDRHTLWKTKQYPTAIGHFADIYEGELQMAPSLIQRVAIKDLRGVPSTIAIRDALRQSLKHSADVWVNLKHPNIAEFLGLAFHLSHIASFISPFYDNGNVVDYLKLNPATDRIKLISGVSAGLLYLHSFAPPVIHADLKGSNVLVKGDGTACLVDFGLILFTNDADFTTTSVAGPCRYQSPEILTFEGDAISSFTTRSDVYAFAMVALEIITGKPPFMHRRQDTPVIFDVIAGRRPHKPEDNPYADRLWPLFNECWAQDPEKRPDMNHVHASVESLP